MQSKHIVRPCSAHLLIPPASSVARLTYWPYAILEKTFLPLARSPSSVCWPKGGKKDRASFLLPSLNVFRSLFSSLSLQLQSKQSGSFTFLFQPFPSIQKENFLRLRESASVRACVRKRMEWRCFNTSEGRRRSSVRSRQKLARGDSDALHFFPLQRSA